MTGKTIARPLTDAERTLVERYHNLIYRVMHDLHLGTEQIQTCTVKLHWA